MWDKLTSRYILGNELFNKSEWITVPYIFLKRHGLGVYSRKPKIGMVKKPRQKVEYFIKSCYDGGDLGKIPEQHVLWFRAKPKQFALLGSTVFRPIAINIDGSQKKSKTPTITVKGDLSNPEFNLFRTDDMEDRFQEIEDIPFLFDIQGRIICIPTHDEIPPRIGIFGATGKGKSLAAHSIIDRAYGMQPSENGDRVAILNDYLDQFGSWRYPDDSTGFIRMNQLVGNTPRALPIVYLYPNSKFITTKELLDNVKEVKEDDFLICLPFMQALKNNQYFFQGIKDLENFGGSDKYVKTILNDLPDDTSVQEVFSAITEGIEKKKGLEEAGNKIKNIINKIVQEQLFNVTTNIPDKWKVWNRDTRMIKEMMPATACLECDLIPCIKKGGIAGHWIYPQYNRWIFDDIMTAQRDRLFSKHKRLWLLIDEIGQYYGYDRKKTILRESVIDMITRGRMANVACIYTIQNKKELDETIINNTTHELVFATSETCFELDNDQKKELSDLKNLECYAIPTKGKFIAYNADGSKETLIGKNGAVRGNILPPLSRHTKP